MTRLAVLFLLSFPFAFVLAVIIAKLSDRSKPTIWLYGLTLLLTLCAVYASLAWSASPEADLVFWVFLMVVALIDFETKTIIDLMIYVGALLLLFLKVSSGAPLVSQLLGGLVGLVVYGLIYLLAKLFYKREAFGFGDVLFNGAIGIYLGIHLTLLSSLLTFYVALIAIIISKVIGKIVNKKNEIAFAPYMAISAFVVSIWGDAMIRMYIQMIMR